MKFLKVVTATTILAANAVVGDVIGDIPGLMGAVQIGGHKKPRTPAGQSICTRSPDNECYKTGRPECCSKNNGKNCPTYMTMCDNYPEGYAGWDYCTDAPDKTCYPHSKGYPACCLKKGGGPMNCPQTAPGCENAYEVPEDKLVGAVQIGGHKKPRTPAGQSICTRSPDYKCYKTGRPECCSKNNGKNCPTFMTMCDNYPEGYAGWDYCTDAPDKTCYPHSKGYPACCLKKGGGPMNCPQTAPGCENAYEVPEDMVIADPLNEYETESESSASEDIELESFDEDELDIGEAQMTTKKNLRAN